MFLAAAVISGYRAFSLTSQLADAKHQIDALTDDAQQSARRAARDSATITTATRRAERADHERDSLRAVTLTPRLAARDTARRTADSAVAVAPDTCAPVIAALRQEIAAEQRLGQGYLDLWTVEVDKHQQTTRDLQRASLALAEAARDLDRLAKRADAVTLPRESWLARLLPKTSAGCTAGVNPASFQPGLVCGLSVGWEVKL